MADQSKSLQILQMLDGRDYTDVVQLNKVISGSPMHFGYLAGLYIAL